jgi:hypothetical protein
VKFVEFWVQFMHDSFFLMLKLIIDAPFPLDASSQVGQSAMAPFSSGLTSSAPLRASSISGIELAEFFAAVISTS